MKPAFIDTNVILDLLMKRERFYKDSQRLFMLADRSEITLLVSALSISNIHYLLCKTYSTNEASSILQKLKVMIEIVPLNDKILELALSSKFKDFEDAIQYYSAIDNNSDIIITRNEKDFKLSQLPIMNTNSFIKEFSQT